MESDDKTVLKTIQTNLSVSNDIGDIKFSNEALHADLLKLEYPIFAGEIDEKRANGQSDNDILKDLHDFEFKARAFYTQEEVEKKLERTLETWKLY